MTYVSSSCIKYVFALADNSFIDRLNLVGFPSAVHGEYIIQCTYAFEKLGTLFTAYLNGVGLSITNETMLYLMTSNSSRSQGHYLFCSTFSTLAFNVRISALIKSGTVWNYKTRNLPNGLSKLDQPFLLLVDSAPKLVFLAIIPPPPPPFALFHEIKPHNRSPPLRVPLP